MNAWCTMIDESWITCIVRTLAVCCRRFLLIIRNFLFSISQRIFYFGLLRLFTALVDSYASLRAKNASSHLASALRSALTGAAAHSRGGPRADCGAAPAGVASIAFRRPNIHSTGLSVVRAPRVAYDLRSRLPSHHHLNSSSPPSPIGASAGLCLCRLHTRTSYRIPL